MRTRKVLCAFLAVAISLQGTVALAETVPPVEAAPTTSQTSSSSSVGVNDTAVATDGLQGDADGALTVAEPEPQGTVADSAEEGGNNEADEEPVAPNQSSAKPVVTATPNGNGSVTLSWDAVEGATAYAIAERMPNGAFHTFTYECVDTSYVVDNLTCGVSHRFLVQAKVAGVWTPFNDSDIVSVVPEGTTKPSVKATGANGSVLLSWSSVPGASRYAVASRRLGSSAWTTATYDCRDTSYTVGGLANGVEYEFVVQASVNGAWTAFSSVDVVACKPVDAASPAVTATATGDGQVTLSWGAVDGAERYAVAEKLGDGTYKTFTLDETGTTYVVSDLANGVSHRFLVQARVDGRWSSVSDALLVSCTPAGATKPSVVAAAGDGAIHLSWNRVSGATRYLVVSSYGKSYEVSKDSTSLNLTGLRNGASYSFCVRAQFQGTWSKALDSDWVSCTPTSAEAPVPVVSQVSDNSVALTWSPIPDATAYAVASKTANGYKTYTLACTDTSFVIDGLSAGKEYRFLVQAFVNGKWSAFSDANLIAARTANRLAPKAEVASTSGTNVTLEWNAVEGATKYAVAERVGDGYKTFSYGVTGTSFTIENLSKSVTHRFLVQAFVDGKWSDFSDDDLIAVALEDEAAPKVTGSCTGDGQVTLSWAPVSGATKYAVAEYVNGSYKTYTLDCTSTSYVVSNLGNGYEHRFLVQAFVGGAWSSFGDAVLCGVVPHGTISPSCRAVAADYSVKLDWDAVPGATRYAVAVKDGNGYKTYTLNCVGTSYEVTGLDGARTYEFLVQAYVGDRWSAFSEADLVSIKTTGKYLSESERLMTARVTRGWYSSATRYLLLVDTSRNEVGVFYGNGDAGNWNLIKLIRCTSGASNTPTVKGSFTVGSKGMVFGDGYSCWYWTQFYKDYLFHSVLYYPGSQSHIMDGRIGINASHGCVRLELQNAKWIYDNIPSGSRVIIY